MSVYKVGNKWRATKYIKGKNVHLGYFKLKREAVAAFNGETIKSVYKIANAEHLDQPKQAFEEINDGPTVWARIKAWLKGE